MKYLKRRSLQFTRFCLLLTNKDKSIISIWAINLIVGYYPRLDLYLANNIFETEKSLITKMMFVALLIEKEYEFFPLLVTKTERYFIKKIF